MSATLRYDISHDAACSLMTVIDYELQKVFAFKSASRCGGIHKSRYECVTFAIKLPSRAWETTRLLNNIDYLVQPDLHFLGTKSLDAVAKKIRLSMGFPGNNCKEEENGFMKEIFSANSLIPWLIYADWLEERGDLRGELVRAWNGKKAIKCKYGIPLLARKIGGLS